VVFQEQWAANLSVSPARSGEISPDPSWIDANTTVELTATPAPGYVFNHWSGFGTGSVNSSDPSIEITMVSWIKEQAVFAPTYSVTFTETGLPAGTRWSVNVSGIEYTSTSFSILIAQADGVRGFEVGELPAFRPVPVNSTFDVEGAPLQVPIHFYPRYPPPHYALTFLESGLPTGTEWNVTIRGARESSTSSTIGFLELNGTYGFQVAPVAGYRSVPTNSSVVVDGSAEVVSVTFTPLTPPGERFLVTFSESGLPALTGWWVQIRGTRESSNGTTITFEEPNGSYGYTVEQVRGYHDTTPDRGFNVSGTPATLYLNFTPIRQDFSVAWNETGLWSPVSWSVTLGGTTYSSNRSWFETWLRNGTYSVLVAGPAGFIALPHRFSLTVAGADIGDPIVFIRATFPIDFHATGLPSDLTWGVRVSDGVHNVTSSSTSVMVANGSYTFDVMPPEGFYASPSHGSISVSATPVNLTLGFFHVGPPARPSSLYLAIRAGAVAGIGLLAAFGTFGLVAWVTGRRRKPSETDEVGMGSPLQRRPTH
jgi:hypothetical protein